MEIIPFTKFISEMAMSQADEVESDEVMESLKDLGDKPILWRGQTAGRKIGRRVILYRGVVKVTQEKESFKGAILNPKIGKVIKKLGFDKKPVFASFNKDQTSMFGSAGAIVPKEPFTIFWNDNIRDLAGNIEDDSFENIIKGYKSTDKIDVVHTGEILIKCDTYYWITIDTFFNIAKKSKFNKFKSIDEIKTYKDLYDIYKQYKSYSKWLNK